LKSERKETIKIPKELMKDEIANPDVQRNLVSLLYCTESHKKLQKLANKKVSK